MFTVGHNNNILFHEYAMYIRNNSNIPIVFFVYGKFSCDEEIRLLNAGVDQVIDLPIDLELAVEKCITLIRRDLKQTDDKMLPMTIYIAEKLLFCVEQFIVIVDDKEIELLDKECRILHLLIANRGQVVTFNQILYKVWGYEYVDSCKAIVWNQIKNLRNKLQWNKGLPEYILTVRNNGYRFNSHCLK